MNHSQNYHLFASYIQMINSAIITNAQEIDRFTCSVDAANGIPSRKRKILQSQDAKNVPSPPLEYLPHSF
jgi:hypothetical protein